MHRANRSDWLWTWPWLARLELESVLLDEVELPGEFEPQAASTIASAAAAVGTQAAVRNMLGVISSRG